MFKKILLTKLLLTLVMCCAAKAGYFDVYVTEYDKDNRDVNSVDPNWAELEEGPNASAISVATGGYMTGTLENYASAWCNEDGDNSLAKARAALLFKFVWRSEEPGDLFPGYWLTVSISTDHDTESFAGIYGDGSCSFSVSASAHSQLGHDGAPQNLGEPICHAHADDGLGSWGSASAWYDPYWVGDWTGLTEYEEERSSLAIAIMDGDYSHESAKWIPKYTTDFTVYIGVTVEAYAYEYLYYDPDVVFWTDSMAEMSTSINMSWGL